MMSSGSSLWNVNDFLVPTNLFHKDFVTSNVSIYANGAGWWSPGDLHCCAVKYFYVKVCHCNGGSCREKVKLLNVFTIFLIFKD